ncbi:MAG: DNA repair protein RadC [Defluviitaleaceae bacterium]|nr:DNA repair protein RadC [Defluviitaleaceae bacterium]
MAEKKRTPKKENPHTKHRTRTRNRYRRGGLEGFADHEVIEFLLYYVYVQRDTNEIAHNMLNKFGSLHNLFETDVEELMSTLNCTENIAVLLNLIPALANRYFRSKWSAGLILDDVEIAGQFAIDLFVGKTMELFYVLCLDKRHRLIHAALISEGTVDEVAVYSRKIAHEALKHKANYVILTHNHPSGTLRPSRGDLESTKHIVEGMKFIDIDVLDHIIVAGDTYYSFDARGQYVRGY